MHHVSTQTEKMVDVAMTTIEAAETEEAIGNMDDSVTKDPELQVRAVLTSCGCVADVNPFLPCSVCEYQCQRYKS